MSVTEQDARARLGASLRAHRKEAGYTLADFGNRIGVGPSGLSRMEKGERGIDTLVLRRAAEVLGVGLDAFFPSEEPTVMARDGGVEDERLNEMVDWAVGLQRDMDVVERFGHGAA